MKCHDIEKSIDNQTLTDLEKEHIKNCPTCQLYQSLQSSHLPLDIDYNKNKSAAIQSALRTAELTKKKHNILMLLLFIVIASSIMFSCIILLTSESLIKYSMVMSAIMPMTLPLILLIKRKVVSHGN